MKIRKFFTKQRIIKMLLNSLWILVPLIVYALFFNRSSELLTDYCERIFASEEFSMNTRQFFLYNTAYEDINSYIFAVDIILPAFLIAFFGNRYLKYAKGFSSESFLEALKLSCFTVLFFLAGALVSYFPLSFISVYLFNIICGMFGGMDGPCDLLNEPLTGLFTCVFSSLVVIITYHSVMEKYFFKGSKKGASLSDNSITDMPSSNTDTFNASTESSDNN